jgi:membrane protease YdiL (CAAX protease family)
MTTVPIAAPAPMPRALLFLLICSPIWLTPRTLAVAHPILLVAAMVALSFLFLRREGRSLEVLGLDVSWRRARELAAGFAGGALLIAIIAIGVRLLLPFPWAWNAGFSAGMTAWSLQWLLCGNAVEELVFRGYSFDRLIAGIGHWKAQLVTALLFAVFHIANGWSWQVALVGTTVGSLLYGLVFVRWRSIPAATGVHAATNWVRDLLLTDPPTAKTLVAPLSPRPWTSREQVIAGAIMDGVFLVACVALTIAIRRRPSGYAARGDECSEGSLSSSTARASSSHASAVQASRNTETL